MVWIVCSHVTTKTKIWNKNLGDYFKTLVSVNAIQCFQCGQKSGSLLECFITQTIIKANNILATRESSHIKIIEHCFVLLLFWSWIKKNVRGKKLYHLDSWWEDMTWQKEESRGWFQLDMGRGEHVDFIPHCGRFCLDPMKESKKCLKENRFIFPFLAEKIWVDGTYGSCSYLFILYRQSQTE